MATFPIHFIPTASFFLLLPYPYQHSSIIFLFLNPSQPNPIMASAAASSTKFSTIFSSQTSSKPAPKPSTTNKLALRRDILKGLALTPLVQLTNSAFTPAPAQARDVVVGSYLPAYVADPSFVVFKATPKDTPALRAGNVEPYQFIIPPSWKQTRVANILSGNYCQPKCAEPWVEVKFEDDRQGKIQVVASPLIRLTNKLTATIEEIGSPEKLIASLGPFVTGNTYDPDELLEASVEKRGDQTYYKYALETPFALTGSHNLAKATSKGSTVVLFVVSASDKQWQTSRKTLEAMLDSFQV